MTTRERLQELIWQPGFHTRTLEDIGKELGVTRERIRQLLQDIKAKKGHAQLPATKRLAWLRAMSDSVLVSTGKQAGCSAALAKCWGIWPGTLSSELQRRGISTRELRPPTFLWLKEHDHDEWCRQNTAKCRAWRERDGNRERLNANIRAWNARNPGKQAEYHRRWYAKRKAADRSCLVQSEVV